MALLIQDAGSGPEVNLLEAELHHLLHQAILRVPALLRIVLVLHDMEELTTEQVAQILELQQGTVRIRLHRARLRVGKEMNQILGSAAGQSERTPSALSAWLPRPHLGFDDAPNQNRVHGAYGVDLNLIV